MMAKFYGFNNLYSVGARNTENKRIGYVVVFSSRAARDEWVNGEVLRNGNYCREVITAKEARREMLRVAYDDLLSRHVVWERADVKHVPMDEIIRAYFRAYSRAML